MTTTQKTETTKGTTSKKSVNSKKQSSAKSSKSADSKKKIAKTPAKPVVIIDKPALSKCLEISTGKISKEINGISKSFCKIGYELLKVREEKTYLGLDYNSVVEYAEAAFKMQKSSVANYISICERFSVKKDGKPTAKLLPEYESFNYGQLSIMLALPDKKIPEITPDKTCSEIREIKKQEKIKQELKASGGSASSVGFASSGNDNRIEYVVSWNYNNEPNPIKTAVFKISPDKVDKIYKEICVLLTNDWSDFGRDGDSLTVSLVNK